LCPSRLARTLNVNIHSSCLMNGLVIRVENLGKQYTLGSSAAYHTLGERLGTLFTPSRREPRTGAADRRLWALRDVSFNVRRGEVVGIIGRNGAGKSTLLKILSRVTEPTEGEADLFGRVGSLLEVGTGFHPELTGRENIFLNGAILGMKRAEIVRKFADIVAFAEVERFIDTAVKYYSSGMYTRLAFAVAAHLEPEILVVDEVLAVGDAEFQRRCLGKMSEVARDGRTILFVSHNMAAVRNLCSRVMLLANGVVGFDGATGAGIDRYCAPPVDAKAKGEPQVLYEASFAGADERHAEIEVTRIELRGPDGKALADMRTWGCMTLRLAYVVRRPVRNAHFGVEVIDHYGRRLLALETRTHMPRHDLGMADGVLDCTIRQLPLAPGTFALGASVFVPDQRVIWAGDQLAQLTVHPDDVFGHGHLPASSHAAVVTPHDWAIPS